MQLDIYFETFSLKYNFFTKVFPESFTTVFLIQSFHTYDFSG